MANKRITIRKNNLYRDKNVYLIGIELTGPSLAEYDSPFVLEAHLAIESQDGTKGNTVLNKTTSFANKTEPHALYSVNDKGYSTLKHIFVYYEALVFDLGVKEIESIDFTIHCVDKNGNLVFEETQSHGEITDSWDKEIIFNNLRILYSIKDEHIISNEFLNELYDSYKVAEENLLVNVNKQINVYVSSSYLNIYDIIKYVPVERVNAFSLGGNDIVMIVEENNLARQILSPHEFCHAIIHDIKTTELGGAAKAFEEGICEWISRGYSQKLGWLPMQDRALIMLEVIQQWYGSNIVDIFKKKLDSSAYVPFEMYYILPLVIENILQKKKMEVLDITQRIENRDSIFGIISIFIEDVEEFLKEIVDLIDDRIRQAAEEYSDLFYQRKTVFLNLKDDINYEELAKLKTVDMHFYEAMMNGRFDTARTFLSDYQIVMNN